MLEFVRVGFAKKIRWILVLSTLLITACGGGGGGGDDDEGGGGAPANFVVSVAVSANGSVSPGNVTVDSGSTTQFTITPDSGFNIASVTGCNGSLSGNTYTTGRIDADCTVSASFIVAHLVTATVGSNGSISSTSEQVSEGSITQFVITPDSGFNIDTVTGCNGTLSGNTYTTGVINGPCAITVTFITAFLVSTTTGANGSISPSSEWVSIGATTQFTLTPDANFEINSVTGCSGILSGNVYTTGAINAACTVDASFNIITHSVSTTAGPNGGISPTPSLIVNQGSTAQITVTPDAGFNIDAVSGCGTGNLAGNVYTTGVITGPCTVSATFITAYQVDATAGANGSINPSGVSVNEGATTQFTVTPDSNFQIDTVTGCSGSLSGNTYTTGAINAACTVNATFIEITHLVSTTVGANGSINPGNVIANQGSTVQFTVTPDSGFNIESVTGCSGSLSGNTYTTASIGAPCTVSATFIASYQVDATAGANGSINPSSVSVNEGSTTQFTVTPDTNFQIDDVTGCSGSLSGNTYTTGAISAACTVNATFIEITHLVSVTVGANGSINPGNVTANQGSTVQFTVTPDSGFNIDSVTGCSGSLSGNTYTTASIGAPCTVSATFIAFYQVDATAGANGSINPSGISVNEGSTTQFTVTPDSGFNIDAVTGCNGSLSGNTYTTGAISAACTVSATFITAFQVDAIAGANGDISPSSVSVNEGATTQFTVTPDSGFNIDSVTGCGGSLSGNTYTTAAITGACTVSATFIAFYQVDATAGANGSINPSGISVNEGSTTQFTVTPDSGFNIDAVTGCNGSLSGNTYTTGAITSACTVSATFITGYQVDATAGANGDISPSSVSVNEGSTTQFTVTPDTNFEIDDVTGCSGSLSGNTYTTSAITAACTVNATFTEITHLVSASAGADGSISPDSVTVNQGDTTQFTVTPDSTFIIENVTGCGGSLTDNTYTTDVISAPCTVSATFIPIPAPVVAAEPTLSFAQTKIFRFTWTDVADASHYRVLENANGGAGFSQVGSDILQGTETTDIVVPIHSRLNATYLLQSCSEGNGGDNCTDSSVVAVSSFLADLVDSIGYIKGSNTDADDRFGETVSLSDDGNLLAVGAVLEDSSSTGVDGDENNDSAVDSGAVYVFARSGNNWVQEAYIKASNTEAGDRFGRSVILSGNGNTLAVGADLEDSNATIIDGDGTNNNAADSGAVYVFIRVGGSWVQQAYIKANNAGGGDQFGQSVGLSDDGDTLAVTANLEDSNAVAIDGDGSNNTAVDSGAVYVFSRTGSDWTQQAYIKASNTGNDDQFGQSVALSDDGDTLAVGADMEDSNATVIDGDGTNDNAADSGAVYVFSRSGTTWSQQAYVKASNSQADDRFGHTVTLSSSGDTLAAGAYQEDSMAVGIDGDESDNSANDSGAVYVFSRSGTTWTKQAYVKASNSEADDGFGKSINLSSDGNTLAVGAGLEDGNTAGIGGDESDNSTPDAGGAYIFNRSGTIWAQQVYVKAANTDAGDNFGVSVNLNGNASALAIGAHLEDSGANSVSGDQTDNSSGDAGAVYLY